MFEKKAKLLKANDSMSLNKEIDSTMAVFTDTISKLKTISDNANIEKTNKEEELKSIQNEISSLDSVIEKANNFVDKISKLF